MSALPMTGVDHVCVVTADLDRAMNAWWDRYGIGPWKHFVFDDRNMDAVIDGEPISFGMRVGLANLGPHTMIELIEPLDDRSPYAASLAERDGADHFHHIKIAVEDFDGASSRLLEAGAPINFKADFTNPPTECVAFSAYYHETEPDLGMRIELGHAGPSFAIPEPLGTYPEAAGA